jgi:tetratricopeptide (TPR) repeat protein
MTSSSAQEGDRPSGWFVGRERELAELRTGLRDVTAGHSHLFLLSGEPGIGKTRLADEFGRQAVAHGVRVAWGRCWEGSGAPAYRPWSQVLRACLGDADAEQRAAILGSEATPQVAQDIGQLLPELRAAHPTPRPPGPQPTDPEQARFQLFESVATLLKNVARIGPLVIVIDDLHDADHPSLLLLKFIAGHGKDAGILLVGTYRDTEVRQSPELTRLLGDLSREGHSIPIVGLSEAEVGEFVASSSGKKADQKLVAHLYQAADGNPLFVDGVLRLLIAEGKLDQAVAGDAFKIPDGVQESIRRRLVKLPKETNLLLSIASVIGTEVESQLLAKVSGSTPDEIVERMEGALRAGIMIDSPIGDSHYRFSHPLVREALYQDLPTKRRIQLHGQIGVGIEEVHKDDLKPHLAALAHHFRAVGDVRNAINYSIAAADAAEAVFAYEDALSHLRPALIIAESHDHDGPQRAAMLLRLGRIVVFFENHEQGVAYLESALKIFEQIGDDRDAGEVHSHLGRAFMNLGPQLDVHRTLSHLQRAEALLGETSEQRSLGPLYNGFAWTSHQAMRGKEAIATSQKAMEIFARVGDRESWACVAGYHCHYLVVKGKLARAIPLIDEIAAEAPGFVNPDAFRAVNQACGWFWMLMKDPSHAKRHFRLGLRKPGHDKRLQSMMLQWLTLCEALVGNLVEAKRLAAENSVIPTFLTVISYHDGDWKAAGEALEKTIDQSRSIGAKWEELNALSLSVDLRRVTGDYLGATADLKRAMSLYQPDDLYWEVRIRPQGVMLYFDTAQREKAAEYSELCRKILAGEEDWLPRSGHLWRAEAIAAALQDGFDESDRYFEKSLEILQHYSLPWDAAETLHYWGKALLQAGQLQRAREKLDEAIKIYRDHRTGQSWIDRVEADRRRAQLSSDEPQLQSGYGGAETGGREAVFRREGEYWTLKHGTNVFRLRHSKGLDYLAKLLASPGREFHALEMAQAVAAGPDEAVDSDSDEDDEAAATEHSSRSRLEVRGDLGDAGAQLDDAARAAYGRRLTELHDEIDEAHEFKDDERAARAQEEIDALGRELKGAIGLAGRTRRAASSGERARIAVTQALRLAISKIAGNDATLGKLLSTTIKTGTVCSYVPDDRFPVSWRL